MIFAVRKLESLAVVWLCFDAIPECDRHTDRHTTMAYTALAQRRAVTIAITLDYKPTHSPNLVII